MPLWALTCPRHAWLLVSYASMHHGSIVRTKCSAQWLVLGGLQAHQDDQQAGSLRRAHHCGSKVLSKLLAAIWLAKLRWGCFEVALVCSNDVRVLPFGLVQLREHQPIASNNLGILCKALKAATDAVLYLRGQRRTLTSPEAQGPKAGGTYAV
jgi:hypothetical protein